MQKEIIQCFADNALESEFDESTLGIAYHEDSKTESSECSEE